MKILSGLENKISDAVVMSGRCMRHSFRSIDTLITVAIMPIMMMVMFVYIFGGAINTGAVKYVDYIVPGIILMCIMSGAAYEALRINNDLTKGIFDRFRTMPIAKSSILGGHILTSVVFNAVSSLIIMLFALLIGFRSDADILKWLLIIGILLLFTLAMTWISAFFGLLAHSAEGAGVFSYILLFMLFISSAFTPTQSMNSAVRAFADNQPMTPIIEAVRSLMLNEPVGHNVLTAILWCVGIIIVAFAASMQIYKHKTA
ncbi:MAG: ABC transporter permease [Bacillota bacterium]|nr:ABC transporter permease [Bacillota bacterium]